MEKEKPSLKQRVYHKMWAGVMVIAILLSLLLADEAKCNTPYELLGRQHTLQPRLTGPLHIVVMDTGYSGSSQKICPAGSYNAVENKEGLGKDEAGHGTLVLDTIEKNIEPQLTQAKTDEGYCFIVIKVFRARGMIESQEHYAQAMYKAMNLAYMWILKIKPDFVNCSFATADPEANQHEDEFPVEEAVVSALQQKTIFVTAAGNNTSKDQLNLDKICNIFPACLANDYPNVVPVGGLMSFDSDQPHPQSARGRIIKEWAPFCNKEFTFCGTSHATPVVTARLVNQYFRREVPKKKPSSKAYIKDVKSEHAEK